MAVFIPERRGLIPRSAPFLFLALVFMSAVVPAASASYADELTQRAASLRLHDERYWRVLLHYKPRGMGVESLVDDPGFFLSASGKTDPAAELKATIEGFFAPVEAPGDRHASCRFPARLEWLSERLSIERSRLPSVECAEFKKAYAAVNPTSAELIFPASHMNSPASMFGHTLIRIDGASRNKLTSYAVNYSAVTDETSGFVFSVKGLAGYYRGYFSVLPYYEKVKEYSDMDQRDMWEYKFTLDGQEVRRMFLHIWELKDIYSYYYFMDENCSYNLMFLLEAARPSARLTDGYGPLVVPGDTIRAAKVEGVAGEAAYRPSMATRIKGLAGRLDGAGAKMALAVAEGALAPDAAGASDLPPETRMTALDAAAELIQYRYSRKEMDKDSYAKAFLETLTARSRLGKAVEGQYAVAAPPPPEAGHGTRRFSLAVGSDSGALYAEVRFRPAYHDLTDPEGGYLDGSQIVFADVAARYYHEKGALRLEALDLINIVSITPRDDFFKPLSWKVDTGFFRERGPDGLMRTVFKGAGGPGAAYRVGGGLVYLFAEAELKAGASVEGGYSFGLGASAGILKSITDRWRVQLEASGAAFGPYGAGEETSRAAIELNQRYKLGENDSIKLNLKRQRRDGAYSTAVSLGWSRYF